ncbi:hypothetical protein VIGAN_UM185600 [Vigna angularis var. angularis]|uniref:Uncharacterized protein n=1 Tax=Vigna angularis var. angularis TaxID=157739 RepID=A0A0S3TFB0_PHAAN|nr:hypothetical protein VIGAN_UM185600 [Vigna angularis var. angularis]
MPSKCNELNCYVKKEEENGVGGIQSKVLNFILVNGVTAHMEKFWLSVLLHGLCIHHLENNLFPWNERRTSRSQDQQLAAEWCPA